MNNKYTIDLMYITNIFCKIQFANKPVKEKYTPKSTKQELIKHCITQDTKCKIYV